MPTPTLKSRVMMAFLMPFLALSIGCCDHCADLMSLSVSHDSKLIASLCGVYKACVWDATAGKLIATYEMQQPGFYTVAFSPKANLFALGLIDGSVMVYEWRTRKRISVLQNEDAVYSEAFSPGGEELAAAGMGWPVRVWSVRTGRLIRQLPESALDFQNCGWHPSPTTGESGERPCLPHSLAYSPDGKTIAVGSKVWLRLWDAASGAVIRTFPGAAEIGSIAFSPDGELLASSGEDGSVAIWDARAGTRHRALQLSRRPLRTVAFSPDGKNLAASGWDGNIYICDSQTGAVVRKIAASRGAVNWVNFSADGADVISGGRDDNLIVTWQISTGKQLREISCLSTVSP
jgi:WD40 repeat protein